MNTGKFKMEIRKEKWKMKNGIEKWKVKLEKWNMENENIKIYQQKIIYMETCSKINKKIIFNYIFVKFHLF
jgi:hypothetical protein